MTSPFILGIAAAVLAAVAWSLSFIVPFVIGRYSLFDFALVEFVFSGILAMGLLWRHADAVRELRRGDWVAAGSLGLIGYFGYFLAVMGAAVYAGPVIAPAFLGLVPVVLAVAGNLRERTVAWRRLILPLTLASAGLLLVNGSGLLRPVGMRAPSPSVGIALALLAVALWTLFGLFNQSALAQRPRMDAGVWTGLIVIGAAAAMLMFVPVGMSLGLFKIPRLGLAWRDAAPLLSWGAGLAVFANIGGAMAWTFASQRLPVALSAQLISVEPAAATILGLLVHHRWPAPAEVAGMALLLSGVLIAIRIFTRRTSPDAEFAVA